METTLLHVLNGVYSAVDSKRAALPVTLYISTAFDTISHSLLLSRIESDNGVRSNVLKWIQSYVMERKQFAKLECHTSATSPCTAGVPQSSVLGPLLFTAYVVPIGRVTESFGIGYHQVADDTQLFVAVPHAHSASCAPLADARNRHYNCVQYRRDTDRLLQFLTVRCTSSDV